MLKQEAGGVDKFLLLQSSNLAIVGALHKKLLRLFDVTMILYR